MSELNPFTTTVPKLEAVTERYTFVSTAQFIQDVESFGYKLESTTSPRRGLGMHSMSFSHPALPKSEGLGMRLLATNSHDATSAFRLYVQVLVQVCSNGLVAWRPSKEANGQFRVVHRGYAIEKVKDAVDRINSRFGDTIEVIETLKNTEVSPENAAAFLMATRNLRDAQPYNLMDLQRVRHSPQSANTAWNVFNRVQEALIKGGYKTIETLPDGRVIPGRRAKEITQVKEKVTINTKLWELAVTKLLNNGVNRNE